MKFRVASTDRNVGSDEESLANCTPTTDHRRDSSLTMDDRIPGTRRGQSVSAIEYDRLPEG
jgi:hypothetical protein